MAENLEHVFFEWPVAVQVWRMSGLWDDVQHAFAGTVIRTLLCGVYGSIAT